VRLLAIKGKIEEKESQRARFAQKLRQVERRIRQKNEEIARIGNGECEISDSEEPEELTLQKLGGLGLSVEFVQGMLDKKSGALKARFVKSLGLQSLRQEA
jgi:hypothetical protein